MKTIPQLLSALLVPSPAKADFQELADALNTYVPGWTDQDLAHFESLKATIAYAWVHSEDAIDIRIPKLITPALANITSTEDWLTALAMFKAQGVNPFMDYGNFSVKDAALNTVYLLQHLTRLTDPVALQQCVTAAAALNENAKAPCLLEAISNRVLIDDKVGLPLLAFITRHSDKVSTLLWGDSSQLQQTFFMLLSKFNEWIPYVMVSPLRESFTQWFLQNPHMSPEVESALFKADWDYCNQLREARFRKAVNLLPRLLAIDTNKILPRELELEVHAYRYPIGDDEHTNELRDILLATHQKDGWRSRDELWAVMARGVENTFGVDDFTQPSQRIAIIKAYLAQIPQYDRYGSFTTTGTRLLEAWLVEPSILQELVKVTTPAEWSHFLRDFVQRLCKTSTFDIRDSRQCEFVAWAIKAELFKVSDITFGEIRDAWAHDLGLWSFFSAQQRIEAVFTKRDHRLSLGEKAALPGILHTEVEAQTLSAVGLLIHLAATDAHGFNEHVRSALGGSIPKTYEDQSGKKVYPPSWLPGAPALSKVLGNDFVQQLVDHVTGLRDLMPKASTKDLMGEFLNQWYQKHYSLTPATDIEVAPLNLDM